MSVVLYGFFGEDAGQRRFLDAYLPHCGGDAAGVVFEAAPYFGKRFGPMNNKVVDRLSAAACREAFVLSNPQLKWLFIGRDVDSFEPGHYQLRADALRASVAEWQDRTLLLLPVQCIEHWLLYLAHYPSREVLERKPNDQTKAALYADRTKSRDLIVADLLTTISPERIAWLLGVSSSFRAFHQQVTTYLAAL